MAFWGFPDFNFWPTFGNIEMPFWLIVGGLGLSASASQELLAESAGQWSRVRACCGAPAGFCRIWPRLYSTVAVTTGCLATVLLVLYSTVSIVQWNGLQYCKFATVL